MLNSCYAFTLADAYQLHAFCACNVSRPPFETGANGTVVHSFCLLVENRPSTLEEKEAR
jgi:hypothetical protein